MLYEKKNTHNVHHVHYLEHVEEIKWISNKCTFFRLGQVTMASDSLGVYTYWILVQHHEEVHF